MVENLISESQYLLQRIANLEFLIDCYFELKDDKGDVKKYVEQRLEKLNKDRVSSSNSNNRQQKVSTSEGGDSKSDGGGKKKDNNKKKEENDNESL